MVPTRRRQIWCVNQNYSIDFLKKKIQKKKKKKEHLCLSFVQILVVDLDTHPNPENVMMENEQAFYLLLLPWMPETKIYKTCRIIF